MECFVTLVRVQRNFFIFKGKGTQENVVSLFHGLGKWSSWQASAFKKALVEVPELFGVVYYSSGSSVWFLHLDYRKTPMKIWFIFSVALGNWRSGRLARLRIPLAGHKTVQFLCGFGPQKLHLTHEHILQHTLVTVLVLSLRSLSQATMSLCLDDHCCAKRNDLVSCVDVLRLVYILVVWMQ